MANDKFINKKALVLLSGGLDSTTCLAIAKHEGYDCYTLSIDYGQKHSVELKAAKNIAKEMKVIEHKVIQLPIGDMLSSALTDPNINVPNYEGNNSIPITYVPSRNIIFLSVALGQAEKIEAGSIFIGVSAIDYSNYPDCRPEFIQAFQGVVNLGLKPTQQTGGITIHAPLLNSSKADTILKGLRCGVNYSMTISCYRADKMGRACGLCESCVLRKQGFKEAGIPDPTIYT